MSELPRIVDASSLKVLVVPVGPIAPAKFARYHALLSRSASEIALADLAIALAEQHNCSFFHRQTFKQGVVHIAFVNESWLTATEWDKAGLQRHIVAIIGLIDCTVTTDLIEAHKQFGDIVAKYDDVWEKRLFAFEQTDVMALEGLSNVVLIPNQEDDKVAFYLSTMMSDLAGELLMALTKRVIPLEETSVDMTQRLKLDAPQRLKRKAPPRTHKFVADACLLGGSIVESLSLYFSAIELGKLPSNSDWLCVAGALEGSICAATMLETAVVYNGDYIEKYREAVSYYEKAAALELAVDACFRIAAYCAEHKRNLLANEFIAQANEYKNNVGPRMQMYLLTTSIHLYGQLGFGRKTAFFIREASRVLSAIDIPSALKILQKLLQAYDITQQPNTDARAHITVEWPSIQISVLQELIRLSELIDDVPQTIYYTAFLLRKFTDFLSVSDQSSLSTRLGQLSAGLRGAALLSGTLDDMPLVASMDFCSPSATMRPIPQAKKTDAAKDPADPFIYNPFQRSSGTSAPSDADGGSSDVMLVQNEPFQVKIALVNVLAVDITVKNIKLSCSGVEFDNPGITLSIPAKATVKDVLLTATPKEPGVMVIRGVTMTVFQMQRSHQAVVSIAK